MQLSDNITICHYCLTESLILARKWQQVSEHCDNQSVFLKWEWICQWLCSLSEPPTVIEATGPDQQCIGLGIFVHQTKLVFPGWFIKQIWLHRAGDSKLDQTWIEHNDFLLHKRFADDTRAAMIDYLATKVDWQECFIGLASKEVVNRFDCLSTFKRIDIDSPTYAVDLNAFASLDDYVNSLSKNTRQQLVRSIKLLKLEGQLTLHEARTPEEKSNIFDEMAEVHVQKWRTTKYGSGFDNPYFNDFHKNILNADTGFSSIFYLTLDSNKLAFIYILKTEDCWSFYLSAIRSFNDNRIKVGMVAHALVIEQAIKQQIQRYDLLAGEARYKQSLSNSTETSQQLVCFYKPYKLLMFRQKARTFKQHYLQKIKKVAESEC